MSCERLSDRMPGVMAGQDHWGREDDDHLAVCSDCRSEWQLLARGAAFGSDLPPLDPARVSAEVLGRLAQAKRKAGYQRRGWVAVGLAAAAALVLVLRPSGGGSVESSDPIAVTALEIPFTELDSLSTEQLQSVLESLEPPLGSTSTLDLPSFQDLDDSQLERLLRSLEG